MTKRSRAFGDSTHSRQLSERALRHPQAEVIEARIEDAHETEARIIAHAQAAAKAQQQERERARAAKAAASSPWDFNF